MTSNYLPLADPNPVPLPLKTFHPTPRMTIPFTVLFPHAPSHTIAYLIAAIAKTEDRERERERQT